MSTLLSFPGPVISDYEIDLDVENGVNVNENEIDLRAGNDKVVSDSDKYLRVENERNVNDNETYLRFENTNTNQKKKRTVQAEIMDENKEPEADSDDPPTLVEENENDHGEEVQSKKNRDYAQEYLNSNPGSTVIIKTDFVVAESPCVFPRMYVYFGSLKRGFLEGCRKVIGLDGCFLKGLLRGEILNAVGRDANNQMF